MNLTSIIIPIITFEHWHILKTLQCIRHIKEFTNNYEIVLIHSLADYNSKVGGYNNNSTSLGWQRDDEFHQ